MIQGKTDDSWKLYSEIILVCAAEAGKLMFGMSEEEKRTYSENSNLQEYLQNSTGLLSMYANEISNDALFEVLIFSSCHISKTFKEKHPNEYDQFWDNFWESLINWALDKGVLEKIQGDFIDFVENRMEIFCQEHNAQIENSNTIKAKTAYLFYENPLSSNIEFSTEVVILPVIMQLRINGLLNFLDDIIQRWVQHYFSDALLSYYEMGLIKDSLKDYHGAITDFTKAIEINSRNADAYFNRSIIKYNLKDYKGAIADLDKAIDINSKDAGFYNNRGCAKAEVKDYVGAAWDFKKVIEINPL